MAELLGWIERAFLAVGVLLVMPLFCLPILVPGFLIWLVIAGYRRLARAH
jgi:hypothetical protein